MAVERIYRGDTSAFDILVNADGTPIDPSAKLWFVLKHSLKDHDARSLAILTTDAGGGIRSNVPAAGSARAFVIPASTASLASKVTRLEYAWRMRDTSGNVSTLKTGVVFCDATGPVALDSAGIGGSSPNTVIGTLAKTLGALALSASGTSTGVTPAIRLRGSTLSPGAITAWGGATSVLGTPKAITDTLTGQRAARFAVGSTVAFPSGAADFMHTGPSTLLIAWRELNFAPGVDGPLLDSSTNGASSGFQLNVREASGQYRRVSARISDGSSFVVDQPTAAVRECYTPLKWNITAVVISGSAVEIKDDHATLFPIGNAVSTAFPTGSGGALTIGGRNVDIIAIDVYASAFDPSALTAAIDAMALETSTPVVETLWGDGSRYYGFASIAKCANGDVVVVCRNGVEHSGDAGWIEMRRRPSGSSVWGAATIIQSDATFDSRDPCLSVMSNGDVLLSYFLQDFRVGATHPVDTCWVRRSTDNCTTWGSPVRGTAGFTDFEACSSRLRDVGGGVVYWPIYGQNIGDGVFSSIALLKSTDGGHTFPTHTIPNNGVSDSLEYTEPGINKLADDTYLLTYREDTNGNMQERTSSDAVTWAAPVNYPSLASNMASRVSQLASGRIIEMLRPGQYNGAATIFTRTAPGVWDSPPDALQIDATPSPTDYGDFLEISPGLIGVAYGVQYDLHGPSDVRYREILEGLLSPGTAIPLVVSPTTLSTTVSTTTGFTGSGAGDITWSMHTNVSGATVNSSTGSYTAGANNGSDVIRATDSNGQFVDIPVTVTGATWNPSNYAGTRTWFSVDALSLSNGAPVTSIPEQIVASNSFVTSYAQTGGTDAPTYVSDATPSHKPAVRLDTSVGSYSVFRGVTRNGLSNYPDVSGLTGLLAFVAFKAVSLAANEVIYGQLENGYEWSIEGDGGGKVRAAVGGSANKAVSNASVVDGAWHFLILTWDKTSGAVTMILDGVTQTATGNFTGFMSSASDLITIGAQANSGGAFIGAGWNFNGYVRHGGFWLSGWSGGDLTSLKAWGAAQIV